MAHLQITTSLLGISLALFILYLLRRDHLHLVHGLFWILVAIAAAILGPWPNLVDIAGRVFGIAYPPALLLLVGILILIIKALLADIQGTKLERDLRRLNQRVAMLELQCSSQTGRIDDC